jgi:hypothetical protein
MDESTQDTVTVEWGHRYVSPWSGGESRTLPAKDEATAERDVADYQKAYGRAPNFTPAWVVCRTTTVTPWGPAK